jgi:hypothetical protein
LAFSDGIWGLKELKNLWFGSQDWGALALVTVGINCLAFSGHDNLHESRTTGKQKTLDDEANINMATLCSGVVPSRRRVSAYAMPDRVQTVRQFEVRD